MHDVVDGRVQRRWRRFVVVDVVDLSRHFDEGEIYRVTRLHREGVEVEVREETALRTESNRVRLSTTTAPEDSAAVVGEVEVVVSPVDERVDSGEPGFAEDEVVVGEGIDECFEVVGVVVAVDGERGGERRDGRAAVGKYDGDWRAGCARERVLLAEGRGDNISFGAAIDQNACWGTTYVTNKRQQCS